MKLLKVFYVIDTAQQRAIARKNIVEYPGRLLWLKKIKNHLKNYKERK